MADPTVRTYDPGQHFASFAGVSLSGFAEGTYLTVERLSEAFTSQAGAGGEVCRVRNRDKRGNFKLILLATSLINDVLSAIADKDEESGQGIGIFHVADGNGTTVVNAPASWIKKKPSAEFADKSPNRTWEFECASLDIFIGGNT
jgi:hypothetical protein